METTRLQQANEIMAQHLGLVMLMTQADLPPDKLEVPPEMTMPTILSAEHLHMMAVLRRNHDLEFGYERTQTGTRHLLQRRQ